MKISDIFLTVTALVLSSFSQMSKTDVLKPAEVATRSGQIEYPYYFIFNGNPLARNHGAADPSVHVWGDTVWMYTSMDHGEGYAGMDSYHAWSSTDLINWTDYGDVFNSTMLNTARWGPTPAHWMWAPGAARKQDANGIWTYYLYYPHNTSFTGETWVTGVATAPNPWGPFTDQGPVKGPNNTKMGMDPMVFRNDDGQFYIYGNSLRVAKLNPDMVTLAEEPRGIGYVQSPPAGKGFGEGSYMHKKNGLYYYSWSNNGGHYATAANPYGPFTWGGTIVNSPTGSQDHHSIIDFNGQWYYFYHITHPDIPAVKDGQTRIACFDRLYYNKDNTIQTVVRTLGPTKILKTIAPNGSIILSPPGGAYTPGTSVKGTSKRDLGFAINSWSGDLSGSVNPVTIIVDTDKTISANYITSPIYTLTVSSDKGSVTLSPSGGVYNSGDEVVLTPVKIFGYKFSFWSGDLSGSEVPGKIIMNSDKNIIANYVSVPTYKITGSAINGIIEFDPPGGTYEEGTVVTVRAKKDFGYEFIGWSGDISDSKNPVTLVMNSDKTITASFNYVGNEKIVFATNCGGEPFRSDEGVYYSADSKYSGGGTYGGSQAISGTTDDVLYQKERFGGSFSYKIPLPNKEYRVTLMFAEIFHESAGKRVFDIFIEGVKVSANLDIWSKVGKNVAYNETHVVKVLDGELTISFTTIKDNAKISAIKVTEPVTSTGTNDLPSYSPPPAETGQNYPNPFQTGTTIPYSLIKASHVTISVFNYLGQQEATLVNEFQNAGKYKVYWDAKNSQGKQLKSGFYTYRLETGNKIVRGGKLIICNN